MIHKGFFVVGDVVRLKSGSADMTISKIYDPDSDGDAQCECIWFFADVLHKIDLIFNTIMLVRSVLKEQ